MSANLSRVRKDLEALYERSHDDPDFAQIVKDWRVETDEQLADLIEADGRLRVRFKRETTLDRYLTAVPDLPARVEPLDAAIDMALRFVTRKGRSSPDVVEKLVSAHPPLELAIRDAAALNNALWSTTTAQQDVPTTTVKELPCDFGPIGLDGNHRYELRELLGYGAFGQVYLAVDRQLSEEDHPAFVSIKVLAGEARSTWERQELTEEATKARRIDHPNAVRVLDRGVSDQNEDFIVYEFVDGGDLRRWARRRSKTIEIHDAVRLTSKIARGVHAAHMAGLVHCDLKPSNIVLSASGEPKVADFGIAIRSKGQSEVEEGASGQTSPRGNLAFMSPEQCRMEPGALTIPSDIYALGGILCWMLTGILPNGSTPEEIRQTHDPVEGRADPLPLRIHRHEVDRDLEAICHRALAVQPEQRYNSAAQFADSLEAWLRREPIPWLNPSALKRLRLWARRKPAVATAVLLIVALVLAGGITIQTMASIANERRLQVAIAETRLEQEEQYRNKFRVHLARYGARLREAYENGLAEQVLVGIWLGEWLFGPTVLADTPERFELWEMRIDVVRDLLNDARARGDADLFQMLLWESALGFWLIKNGEYGEAEDLLAASYTKCEAILDPVDSWLVHLRAMRDCALVGRIAGENGPSTISPDTLRELHNAEASIEEAERLLNEAAPASALHRLVLDHLQLLYGPDVLNDRQRLAGVEARIESLPD